ncbi:hypothetical protein PRUPE_2G202100 [Prunus persica]|uniref:Uncharacterized protein n=1 Tax=Prunus persica TaxID=3760 RepID=A0A251QIQ6_PRUPE|nr:hypothetical protein PRUPE_2G202100 [Prunus persica]
MEWAAGTKLKGSFTFLEESPSSRKPSSSCIVLLACFCSTVMIIIEVALCTEASATWMLESQVTILV